MTELTQHRLVELSLDTKERFVEQVLYVNEQISNLETHMAMLKAKLTKLKNTKLNMEKQATDYILSNVVPIKNKIQLTTDTHILKVTIPHTNKVVITDELLIPKEYIRIKTEESINKEKIKVDLKDGKEVPGAILQDSDYKFDLIESIEE